MIKYRMRLHNPIRPNPVKLPLNLPTPPPGYEVHQAVREAIQAHIQETSLPETLDALRRITLYLVDEQSRSIDLKLAEPISPARH